MNKITVYLIGHTKYLDILSNDIQMIVLLLLCVTLLTENESSLVAGNAKDSFYEPQNGKHIDAGGKRQGDVDDYVYCYRYAKYFATPNTEILNIIQYHMYSWLFRPRQILHDRGYRQLSEKV